MLINKYDSNYIDTMYKDNDFTAVNGSILNIISTNFVIIQSCDLFNESTLSELMVNTKNREKYPVWENFLLI